MSTSLSFVTPMASFSVADLTINQSQTSEHQDSSYASATSTPKRQRTISSVNSPTGTIINANTPHTDDYDDDEERLLGSHYDNKRSKQERLLRFTNIFRVLVICILAPIIYFII